VPRTKKRLKKDCINKTNFAKVKKRDCKAKATKALKVTIFLFRLWQGIAKQQQ